MTARRNALAIAAGILPSLGYLALGDDSDTRGSQVFVGLLFGVTQTFAMIFNQERFNRKLVVYLTVPLLLFLVIHQAMNRTSAEAALNIVFAIAFALIHYAFTRTHDAHKEGRHR